MPPEEKKSSPDQFDDLDDEIQSSVDSSAEATETEPAAEDSAASQPAAETGAGADEGQTAAPAAGESLVELLGPEYAGLSEEAAVQKLEAEMEAEKASLAELPRIREYARQLEQQQQDARFRQIAQETLWQRQQAESQRQQQAQEKAKWEAPEFDPAWLNQLVPDEKGNMVLRPGADSTVLTKIQAWADHRNKVMDRLARDPDGFLQERMQGFIEQQVGQRIQAVLAEQQEVAAIRGFEQQYSTLLYHDPQTMQNLTPLGQTVFQRARAYMANGVQSRAFAAQKAFQDIYQETLLAQQTQAAPANPAAAAAAAPAQQTQQQKREAFLRAQAAKNGGGNRGRNAGRANGIRPPASRKEFEKMMAEELAKDGINLEQPLAI